MGFLNIVTPFNQIIVNCKKIKETAKAIQLKGIADVDCEVIFWLPKTVMKKNTVFNTIHNAEVCSLPNWFRFSGYYMSIKD